MAEETKQVVPHSETQQPDEVQMKTPTESSNPLKIFGNNLFRMSTSVNGSRVDLYGVLNDTMPTLSVKCSWDKGPGATLGDKISQFMNNEALSTFTFVVSSDTYKFVPTDAYTSRMYKKGDYTSFSLNFKAYASDPTNSGLSSYATWLKYLKAGTLLQPGDNLYKASEHAVNTIEKGAMEAVEDVGKFISTITSGVNQKISGEKTSEKSDGENSKEPAADVGNGAELLAMLDNDNFGPDLYRVGIHDMVNGSLQGQNKVSDFGAKIWELLIMPGIFKEHFVVYVENFSVKMSEEVGPDYKPLWAEISISCKTDRIMDRDTMQKKFRL